MNSTNKKAPGAKATPQPFNRPSGQAPQTKPVVAQLKTAVSAQSIKRPVAPPVYHPQATPKAAQPKMANSALNRKPPGAPPVYRPQQTPQVLQTKSASAQTLPAGQAPPTAGSLRGVVQRAQVARRGRGGGGGGGKKPPPNPYKDASQLMLDYEMDEDFQRWLRIGQRVGYQAPVLTGHAGKPGKSGGKAEKARNKTIALEMAAWKVGLLIHLAVVMGINETRLGRIETALGM